MGANNREERFPSLVGISHETLRRITVRLKKDPVSSLRPRTVARLFCRRQLRRPLSSIFKHWTHRCRGQSQEADRGLSKYPLRDGET
jgi:hypothetical protein